MQHFFIGIFAMARTTDFAHSDRAGEVRRRGHPVRRDTPHASGALLGQRDAEANYICHWKGIPWITKQARYREVQVTIVHFGEFQVVWLQPVQRRQLERRERQSEGNQRARLQCPSHCVRVRAVATRRVGGSVVVGQSESCFRPAAPTVGQHAARAGRHEQASGSLCKRDPPRRQLWGSQFVRRRGQPFRSWACRRRIRLLWLYWLSQPQPTNIPKVTCAAMGSDN